MTKQHLPIPGGLRGSTPLLEELPTDRNQINKLIGLAREHTVNWQAFYHHISLLQRMQIEILEPLIQAPSPFNALRAAASRGVIDELQGHHAAYSKYIQSDAVKKVKYPDQELQRYLDLQTLRNHDAVAAPVQGLKAELVRHECRSDYWNDVLNGLIEEIPVVPDGDLDNPVYMHFFHWEQQCEALVEYYGAWRDAELEFTASFISLLQAHRDSLPDPTEQTLQLPRERLPEEPDPLKAGLRGTLAPSDEVRPDGVEGGCWLWWQGERHNVPKGGIYRLLAFMWDRSSASYDDLIGPVFDDPVEPGTIRARASEASRLLQKLGIPWRFEPDAVSRFLTKQPLS